MSNKQYEQPPLEDMPPKLRAWWQRFLLDYTPVRFIRRTITPASVGANTTSEQAFTIESAEFGDGVIAIKPSHTTGVAVAGARVSDADEVSITYVNPTAGAVLPPEEEYIFVIFEGEE